MPAPGSRPPPSDEGALPLPVPPAALASGSLAPTRLLPPAPRAVGLRYGLRLADAGLEGAPALSRLAAGALLLGGAWAAVAGDVEVAVSGRSEGAVPVAVEAWPPLPDVEGMESPLRQVSVRLESGDVLRQVVPAAAVPVPGDRGTVPVRVVPAAPPLARLASLPVDLGRAALALAAGVPGALALGAALSRVLRGRRRVAVWTRGQEVMGTVREVHQSRVFEGDRPRGYRVDVTWEVPAPGGRARTGSLRGYLSPRMVLFEPGQPVAVLDDPEAGASMPVHLLPRGWPAPRKGAPG